MPLPFTAGTITSTAGGTTTVVNSTITLAQCSHTNDSWTCNVPTWTSWVDQATASGVVWLQWATTVDDNSTTPAPTARWAPTTWISWVDQMVAVAPTPPPPPTPEEVAAAESAAARYAARRAEEDRQLELADRKADALLKSCLSAGQIAMLVERGYFFVEVGGRKYRIDRGFAGNVKLVNEHDEPVESYCIHPTQRTPSGDAMLAQKLLLETDEKRFLKTANRTRLVPQRQRVDP